MSGKTPINRLEGWPLSFHLCKEKDKNGGKRMVQQKQVEMSSSSFVAITDSVISFSGTFKLAKHAERERE